MQTDNNLSYRVLTWTQASLPTFFVESWIFSSANNVVSECDKWADLFELDASTQASLNAAKGEILELARIQAC